MCKCNQMALRVDVMGGSTINRVRMFLMVARRQKQMAEITRDYAENGGPQELLVDARFHEVSARYARRQAKDELMELEIRFGKRYVEGRAGSLVSSNRLNGRQYKTWEQYQEIFNCKTKGNLDIWR